MKKVLVIVALLALTGNYAHALNILGIKINISYKRGVPTAMPDNTVQCIGKGLCEFKFTFGDNEAGLVHGQDGYIYLIIPIKSIIKDDIKDGSFAINSPMVVSTTYASQMKCNPFTIPKGIYRISYDSNGDVLVKTISAP